jgi:hypothetical protein
VTFPRLKTAPVLHELRLFCFVRLLEGTLRIGFGHLWIIAGFLLLLHTKLTGLECILLGKPPVLPQYNGALIVSTGEHCAKRIPTHAIDWPVVRVKDGQQALALRALIGKQTLHQVDVALDVFLPLLKLCPLLRVRLLIVSIFLLAVLIYAHVTLVASSSSSSINTYSRHLLILP